MPGESCVKSSAAAAAGKARVTLRKWSNAKQPLPLLNVIQIVAHPAWEQQNMTISSLAKRTLRDLGTLRQWYQVEKSGGNVQSLSDQTNVVPLASEKCLHILWTYNFYDNFEFEVVK